MRNTILLLAFFLLWCPCALADSASIEGGSGGTVRLMGNDQIQLRDEVIRIQVHEDKADFDVAYTFVNTTSQELTVRLGFPQRKAYMDTEALQDFTVLAGGQAVAADLVKGEPGSGEVDGHYLPDMDYYVYELVFAPGETKKVTNTYWTWSTEYRGLWSFDYYLHTGATWKGPIGILDIFVTPDPELAFPGPALQVGGVAIEPQGYTVTDTGSLTWHFENLEPTPADNLHIMYLHAGRPFDVEISASSSLRGQDPDNPDGLPRYDPWRAWDGERETAWVEGAFGPGQGEWLMAEFLEPGGYEVYRVGLLGGYSKGELFKKNNRIKAASLIFSNGSSQRIELEDKEAMQFFEIDPVKTEYVKLVIEEVYRGSKYDDTCVSEFEIYTRN